MKIFEMNDINILSYLIHIRIESALNFKCSLSESISCNLFANNYKFYVLESIYQTLNNNNNNDDLENYLLILPLHGCCVIFLIFVLKYFVFILVGDSCLTPASHCMGQRKNSTPIT